MFPFGLESTYDLHNINISNSMKTVEMIPEFEIRSENLKVDNLYSNDIDEKLVNLETVEREELKIKCLEFETVWIEFKNK